MPTIAGISQSSTSPAEWYSQYVADLTGIGGGLMQEEYQPYGGPRIADFTADQQAGFAGLRDAQGMWQPGAVAGGEALDAGRGGLNAMSQMTQQAGQWNQGAFDNVSNVYRQPMLDMQAAADSIGNRNFQNTTLASLNSNFGSGGQFGSGRHQILGADAAAQAQAQIEEAKASIGMQAAQNTMKDYNTGQQQLGQMGGQMGTYAADQSRMGTDLMNFGLATQGAARADAASLGALGQQQQQMDQQNLNLGYQDFQDQQQYPWQQLDKWSALTRGQNIPQYTSAVNVPSVSAPAQLNPWMLGANGAGGGWGMLTSSF